MPSILFSVQIYLDHVLLFFNLWAAFHRLSSALDIMTWSSANNSVNSCWFFESGIPVTPSFCHLVIISPKYILNSVGERGQRQFILTAIKLDSHSAI
jgi:hypothetical protein